MHEIVKRLNEDIMSDENDAPHAGTMDAIRAALAKEAHAVADSRTFKPAYVWQVVAAALPEIDRIVTASKGRGKGATKAAYDDIAAKLRVASCFEELSGESVRQYQSRLLSGKFDVRLAALGFRRVDNRLVAIADLPEAADAPERARAPLVDTGASPADSAAAARRPESQLLSDTNQNSRAASVEAVDGERSEGRDTGSASPSAEGPAKERGTFDEKPDPVRKRT